MVNRTRLLSSIADDDSFVVEEYNRKPLKLDVLHSEDKEIPFGLELLVERNGGSISGSESSPTDLSEDSDYKHRVMIR